jgi:peptidoglycan/LPS O-acetylase OafA/YrhL
MDLRRLRAGEWMAAVAGVILLAALFQPWYGTPDATAWEAFSVIDLVLAAFAMFAIALLVVTAAQKVPTVPIALDAALALAGMLALVLVLLRVASLPDGADSREWGLWQGLIGVLGINVAAWVAMRDQRLSQPGRPTDLSGKPIAEPQEVELLPAPDPRGTASS